MNNKNVITVTGFDSDGSEKSIDVPVTCSVHLVSSRRNPKLKGVVRLNVAGITINDILIYEDKADTTVVYPHRTITRQGKETETSIAFPNNGYASITLKHIIVDAYLDAIMADRAKNNNSRAA